MAKDRRDPNIWLSPTSIRVELMTKAKNKPCSCCGEKPEDRRLKVGVGSARSATTVILCVKCGSVFLQQMKTESDLTRLRLMGNDIGVIRMPKQERILDIAIENEKAAAKERKRVREAKKEEAEA